MTFSSCHSAMPNIQIADQNLQVLEYVILKDSIGVNQTAKTSPASLILLFRVTHNLTICMPS